MMRIYTIGYEGLNQQSFLKCLQYFDIDVVADVRNLPLSRKKGFSKTGLSELLVKEKIDYFNYRELGVPKDKRNQLKKSGDYESFFRVVRKSISSKVEQLDDICRKIREGKKVALLCYEKDSEKCHRVH